jgi:hypothetical protein
MMGHGGFLTKARAAFSKQKAKRRHFGHFLLSGSHS